MDKVTAVINVILSGGRCRRPVTAVIQSGDVNVKAHFGCSRARRTHIHAPPTASPSL